MVVVVFVDPHPLFTHLLVVALLAPLALCSMLAAGTTLTVTSLTV